MEGFSYDKTKIIIGEPFIMAKQKKPVHRVQMTAKKDIILAEVYFRVPVSLPS